MHMVQGSGARQRHFTLLHLLLLFCAVVLQAALGESSGGGHHDGDHATAGGLQPAAAWAERMRAAGVKLVLVRAGEEDAALRLQACARAGLEAVIAVAPAAVEASEGGAGAWVRRVVQPHAGAVAAVAVTGHGERSLAAVRAVQRAVELAGLFGRIKVSSPVTLTQEAPGNAAAAGEKTLRFTPDLSTPAFYPVMDFTESRESVYTLEVEAAAAQEEEDWAVSALFAEIRGLSVQTALVWRAGGEAVRLVRAPPELPADELPAGTVVVEEDEDEDVAGLEVAASVVRSPGFPADELPAGTVVEEEVAGGGSGRRRELATLRTWCIARPDAGTTALQAALDWACGPGKADCVPLQPGGLCSNPDDLYHHASYAFNSYYQRNSFVSGSCNFQNTATTTNQDPSTSGCVYPASDSSAVTSSPNGTGSGVPAPPLPHLAAVATVSLLVLTGLALSS